MDIRYLQSTASCAGNETCQVWFLHMLINSLRVDMLFPQHVRVLIIHQSSAQGALNSTHAGVTGGVKGLFGGGAQVETSAAAS